MRRYGVVIVTYNRLNLLKECLMHIGSQSCLVAHVIIVDNASTDGTVEYLHELETGCNISGTEYTIVFNEDNKGGAGGFAIGIETVLQIKELDYITLIDDDAMLDKDYFKHIDEAISLFPEIRAFSGSVYVSKNIDTSHRRRVKNKFLVKFEDVALQEYKDKYFEYDLTSFCGATLEYKLITEIGIPRAEYFIRYDDTEYSLRIREKTKIMNVNAATINHKTVVPNSTNRIIDYKLYYDVKNRIDMAKRHFGKIAVFILYLRTIVQIVISGLLYGVSIFDKRTHESMKKRLKFYCYAFVDSIHNKPSRGRLQ